MLTKDKIGINDEIKHILKKLGELDPTTPEYTVAVKNLQILCESKNKTSLDPTMLVGFAVSTLQVVLMLRFERFDVITSKVLSRLKHV